MFNKTISGTLQRELKYIPCLLKYNQALDSTISLSFNVVDANTHNGVNRFKGDFQFLIGMVNFSEIFVKAK
jgi:hypothetical protein